MDASSAYSFFIDVIVPNAVNRYQIDNANQITSPFSTIPQSSEPLVIDILIKCIRDYAITLQKVISSSFGDPFRFRFLNVHLLMHIN